MTWAFTRFLEFIWNSFNDILIFISLNSVMQKKLFFHTHTMVISLTIGKSEIKLTQLVSSIFLSFKITFLRTTCWKVHQVETLLTVYKLWFPFIQHKNPRTFEMVVACFNLINLQITYHFFPLYVCHLVVCCLLKKIHKSLSFNLFWPY